ncbi:MULTISPECIES: hypothetical protein [Prauserella salsuginis group]|uniref:Sporulation protein Cse60 n=2 Tax=Prauserella salsuginis group TaxID=2893672 RepID=A0A839XEM9_9PSEU|nr:MULTISPECIES: hypothetical protein [Prauserella salsuginis group]MBB3662412.1 hypothetical protein [Prauserella sediminis]MCR3720122.1 hypothetical protein [Prauserella flava]MCR3734169.1 hypothetical protein [Prauserella salsuginis]
MKIKTFYSSNPEKLDKKVNEFLNDPAVEVVDIQLSSNVFLAWVLIQYNAA